MNIKEFQTIFDRISNGEKFKLYYQGKECHVQHIGIELSSAFNGTYVKKISLVSDDQRTVETGYRSWGNVYEDVEWYPTHSIQYMLE